MRGIVLNLSVYPIALKVLGFRCYMSDVSTHAMLGRVRPFR